MVKWEKVLEKIENEKKERSLKKIRFTIDWRTHKKGEIITTSKDGANEFIKHGYAEYVLENINDKKNIIYKNVGSGNLGNLIEIEQGSQGSHNYEQGSQGSQGSHIPKVPIEQIKDSILLCLYSNKLKTSNEISKELSLNVKEVSKHIQRSDRDNGLLNNGFVEIKDIKPGDIDVWGLTSKGNEYINNLLKKEEELKTIAQNKINQVSKDNQKINDIKNFLTNEYKFESLSNNKSILIDFQKFALDCPEHAEDLLDKADEGLKFFEIALEDLFSKPLKARFFNLPKSSQRSIIELGHEYFNKLIYIEVTIIGRSTRHPNILQSAFLCPSCNTTITLLQENKIIKEPKRCVCGHNTNFKLLGDHKLETIQKFQIEELSENLHGVNQPPKIYSIAKDEVCSPENQKYFNQGNRLKLVGYLTYEYQATNSGKKKTELDLLFEIISFEQLDVSLEHNLTNKDKENNQNLVKKEDFKEILLSSFCPNIKGVDLAKLSILLSSIRGLKDDIVKRDNIHILLASNPGSGKSELLKEIVKLIPYSRFSDGMNSSKVGLIGAVTKDEFLGGYMLTAGVVPLCNHGICVIDEIDKIDDDDKKSLNGAMEQGEISIHKAVIHQTLKADTTIISACNPINEKFDFNNSSNHLINQIDLPKSTRDRFDLIIALDNGNKKNKFLEAIKSISNEIISPDNLSKYLIQAKEIKPKLSVEIKKYIAETCDNLSENFNDTGFDFGYRQFHAIFRLSYAFTKLRLSNEVTKEDVSNAIIHFLDCLKTLGIEPKNIKESKVW